MVQLTIDTEKETPESLAKIIQLLQVIAGTPSTPSTDYSVPTSQPVAPAPAQPSGDMFSMFGETPATQAIPKTEPTPTYTNPFAVPVSSTPEFSEPETVSTYSVHELLNQADTSEDDSDDETSDKDFFSLMEY